MSCTQSPFLISGIHKSDDPTLLSPNPVFSWNFEEQAGPAGLCTEPGQRENLQTQVERRPQLHTAEAGSG